MKSPWDLLPVQEPREHSPPPGYFYENVIKPLIPDIVRIMLNGIPMDLNKVDELREVVEEVLETVQSTLDKNKTIIAFQAQKFPKERDKHLQEMTSKMKLPPHFLKDFKDSNKIHRTYVMNAYFDEQDVDEYRLDEWLMKDLKDLLKVHDSTFVKLLLEKHISPNHETVIAGMTQLSEDKAYIYNKTYWDKIENVVLTDLVHPFNAGSSTQKNQLFEFLGIESEKLGDAYIEYERDYAKATRRGLDPTFLKVPANKYSWDRAEVEKVNVATENPEIKELTQQFIDHSFSAIIRNNFIAAFDRYVIDDVLYGNLKLGGAKS